MPSKWEHLKITRTEECLVPASRQIVQGWIGKVLSLLCWEVLLPLVPILDKQYFPLSATHLRCSWQNMVPSFRSLAIKDERHFLESECQFTCIPKPSAQSEALRKSRCFHSDCLQGSPGLTNILYLPRCGGRDCFYILYSWLLLSLPCTRWKANFTTGGKKSGEGSNAVFY